MKLLFCLFLPMITFGLSAEVTRPRPFARIDHPAGQPPAQPITAADLQPLEDARRAVTSAMGIKGAPRFDLERIAQGINMLRMTPFTANGWTKGQRLPSFADVRMGPAEFAAFLNLANEVAGIVARVSQREAKHRQALAARGVAELPPSQAACRYRLNLGKSSFLFDKWGELQVDRRFVTREEMPVIKRLEANYRKTYGNSAYAQVPQAPKALPTRQEAQKNLKLPIFRGFEDDRYQEYDDLILKMTQDFNAHKVDWIGGTPEQALKVATLSPALVKSHMIEESGGNDTASKAAWKVDPLQVNVPGDWADVKLDLGLTRPTRRNEGTAAGNVRAAIMFLARKGFGVSGQPARRRPEGFFDGWPTALQRYNARRDRTADGRYYSDAYAEKIRTRAADPDVFVPIEIKLAGK